MKSVKEDAYVRKACAGDEEAFAYLVQTHQRTIIGIAYAISNSNDAVDDLVQDTFLVAWKNLKQLDSPERFTAWLCTIARNLAKNWIRSEVYRRALVKAYREEVRDAAYPSGYRDLMQSEQYAYVRTMLESVSPDLREVMVLFYFEEFPIKEIAQILEISQSNTKKRLERGRKQLRDYFEQDWKAKVEADATSNKAVSNKIIATLAIGPAMPLPSYLSTGSLAAVPTLSPLSQATSLSQALWEGVIIMSTKKVIVTTLIALVLIGMLLIYTQISSEPVGKHTALNIKPTSQEIMPTDLTPKKKQPKRLVTIPPNPEETEVIIEPNRPEQPKKKENTPTPSTISTITGTVFDEWDTPVPGAEISIALASTLPYESVIDEKVKEDLDKANLENHYTTTSNKNGIFRVSADFEQSSGILTARTETAKGTTEFHIANSPDNGVTQNIDVTISEGVYLLGQVLSPKGKPVPGAYIKNLIYLKGGSARGGPMDYAIADAEGIFELLYPDSGTAGIKITSNEGQAIKLNIPVGDPEIIPLYLEEPATVWGMITYANDEPAEGIWVVLGMDYTMSGPTGGSSVSDMQPKMYAEKTDKDGSYEFSAIAPGFTYNITVLESTGISTDSAKSLSPRTDLGLIETKKSIRWDYAIQDQVKITGQVVGMPSSKPIKGIQIRMSWEQEAEAITDENGFFDFSKSLEPGTHDIWPYYKYSGSNNIQETYSNTIKAQYGDEVSVALSLPDPNEVHLRIVDSNGNPIENAKVRPSFSQENSSYGFGSMGTTDAEGRFAWDTMSPLGTTKFTITAEGLSEGISQEYEGQPGTIFAEETIVLYAKAGIEGYALDANGAPLAYADLRGRVYTNGATEYTFISINTDENGYFRAVDTLPATSIEVLLHAERQNERLGEWRSEVIELSPESITNLGDITFGEVAFTAPK